MSFYDYFSTYGDYDSYTGLEIVETCYNVPEENFDAALLEDVEFFRVQPWVLDDLKSRHPDVSEYSVGVKRCKDSDASGSYTCYEVWVTEYFEQ
jgi:hypothetical protein